MRTVYEIKEEILAQSNLLAQLIGNLYPSICYSRIQALRRELMLVTGCENENTEDYGGLQVKFKAKIEEIMGTTFYTSGAYSERDCGEDGWRITFRVEGTSLNIGKGMRLARELKTDDVEVEIHVDSSYVRDPDNYSDPGPDNHTVYNIAGARE